MAKKKEVEGGDEICVEACFPINECTREEPAEKVKEKKSPKKRRDIAAPGRPDKIGLV